ncbi:hypothetical protein ONZ51_g9204 [Trametes cubensis]|uniref:Uncharacterized protein n=1 Tax=Trametes cubensis TaxID=1111947 RepID=A0AAD7TLS7_9APHY|nr:hypothetical protein ONZ51_g9204 [Trametes cubensis]
MSVSGRFYVVNNSSAPVSVFISKYSNPDGSDAWYSISPGKRDAWERNNWELIAFTIGNDDRAGVYVKVNKTVVYNSLTDIVVGN